MILQRNSCNHSLIHPAGANDAANFDLAGIVVIEDISFYVPHDTPNTSNQKLMLGHIVSRVATDSSYFKRSTYVKVVTIEKNGTFELGVRNSVDAPLHLIVGFKQRGQFKQQHQNHDTFYRASVVNCQINFGFEKYPDAGKICDYAINNYSQAYGEIVSCFRHLAKDNTFYNHTLHKKIS